MYLWVLRDEETKMRSAVAQMMPTHVYHEIGEWTCPMLLHLYWPSMIYENEHSEDEECGCNTCGDLDCNVLDTIYEVNDLDGTSTRWHRTLLKERQRLYEARWTKWRCSGRPMKCLP